MANELTIKTESAVALSEQFDMETLIKPLKNEIHLFDTFIAGTTHLTDETPLYEINVGDELSLKREQNRFDDNAIIVLDPKGRKLGYVPEKDNIIFARLMDAGKRLIGKVSDIKPKGGFTQISIGIYLVDF
ncbi:MAG: HIRAN domain-containing protein [Lachnospiraceae bacterium]|nr:HIRAN domain-containing protein [Lachnospiraceae bacterium]